MKPFFKSLRTAILFVFVLLLLNCPAGAQENNIDAVAPQEVRVLPVFFVPQGEKPPTADQKKHLMKHLKWAQRRFREMLGRRDTFRFARETPSVCHGKHDLAFYESLPEGGAAHFAGEMLDKTKYNRFNCPYIYFTVIMNPHNFFPSAGGRPLNGGLNTGGGYVHISSHDLDVLPMEQSTIRHLLGLALGLPRVDAYQYEMTTNPSIMAHNKSHHTDFFNESPTPGILIPEDLRALALNKRCLKYFHFDIEKDFPPETKIFQNVIFHSPMEIEGHPNYQCIEVETESGETYNSKVQNIVTNLISGPDAPFKPPQMWHSDELESGWATIDLKFPFPVTLNKMGIYTQHSGKNNAAYAARIEIDEENEQWREVTSQKLREVDADVSFDTVQAMKWRLHLQAGSSGKVVVRGLRFYNERGELFPQLLPYAPDLDY